jgi:uncharacterized integral membrane protein
MTEFSDIPEDPYDFQNVPRYRGGNRVTRNKLNPTPVARKVTGRIAAPVKRATGIKLPKGATGSGDNGYWTMIIAACLLLWFLYVCAHNELQTWASILFWKPAAPVQVGAAAAAAAPTTGTPTPSSVAAGVAQGAAASGAALSSNTWAGLGSLFDPRQGIGNMWNQFKNAPVGPGGAQNNPLSTQITPPGQSIFSGYLKSFGLTK